MPAVRSGIYPLRDLYSVAWITDKYSLNCFKARLSDSKGYAAPSWYAAASPEMIATWYCERKQSRKPTSCVLTKVYAPAKRVFDFPWMKRTNGTTEM